METKYKRIIFPETQKGPEVKADNSKNDTVAEWLRRITSLQSNQFDNLLGAWVQIPPVSFCSFSHRKTVIKNMRGKYLISLI